MTSERPSLVVRSEVDVQVTIYDANGLKQVVGTKQVVTSLPRGLYRLHLDRCGFACDHLILHDAAEEIVLHGPRVESPAPIEIAGGSYGHAELARRLSARDTAPETLLGNGRHDARLFLFVRRTSATGAAFVPSEPVSIHDITGRELIEIAPGKARCSGDPGAGYLGFSCRVAAGTYRLRVGRPRRELAITIPAGRAAHVFLADHGTISLRTARVYLPYVDEEFDPSGHIARAMESVLWALRQPRGELPPIARESLHVVDRDPSFGIACALLARRQRDRAAFDEIMRLLAPYAAALPDMAILEAAWLSEGASSSTKLSLGTPPLFRASLVLALEQGLPIASHGAVMQAAKAGHDDSMWCTWSPRWWDERWIEPTVDRLRVRDGSASTTVEDLARSTRLPTEIVEQALAKLDAGLPQVDGKPISIHQLAIPGYILQDIVGRGDRSTVFRARRDDDGKQVALKLVPISGPHAYVWITHEIKAIQGLQDRRFVRCERTGMLPDHSALWLEMAPCGESLFDRLAMLDGPMPPDEADDVALRAVESLAYLHARGIVHGNINPGSLLFEPDGTLVLGLPRSMNRRLVIEPVMAGKVDSDMAHFMAPECVVAARATTASDVWAMGATLYFMLTLEVPRERYADQAEQEAMHQNNVVPIGRYLSGHSRLAPCIERALQPAADLRYHDGREFLQAVIEAFASDSMDEPRALERMGRGTPGGIPVIGPSDIHTVASARQAVGVAATGRPMFGSIAICVVRQTTLTVDAWERLDLEQMGPSGKSIQLNPGRNRVVIGPGVFRVRSRTYFKVTADHTDVHIAALRSPSEALPWNRSKLISLGLDPQAARDAFSAAGAIRPQDN